MESLALSGSETLTTDRLELRAPCDADIPDLVAACQDPDLAYYTTIPSPYGEDEARFLIDELARTERTWLVRLRSNSDLVGVVSLRPMGERTAEVGYWIAAGHRRQGLAVEATRAALEEAWQNLPVDTVVWRAQLDNFASWFVARQLGFHYVGIEPDACEDDLAARRYFHRAVLLRSEPMEPRSPLLAALRAASDFWPASASATRPYDARRPADLVRQFHEVYNLPVCDTATPECDRERVHMRMALISEEYAELMGAVYGKQARQLVEEAAEKAVASDDHTRDTVETADALADLIYVIYGMALECGIDLDMVLQEVQASNLSKLGADGRPIYREDGKVLKGPGFFRPDVPAALAGRIVHPGPAGPIGRDEQKTGVE